MGLLRWRTVMGLQPTHLVLVRHLAKLLFQITLQIDWKELENPKESNWKGVRRRGKKGCNWKSWVRWWRSHRRLRKDRGSSPGLTDLRWTIPLYPNTTWWWSRHPQTASNSSISSVLQRVLLERLSIPQVNTVRKGWSFGPDERAPQPPGRLKASFFFSSKRSVKTNPKSLGRMFGDWDWWFPRRILAQKMQRSPRHIDLAAVIGCSIDDGTRMASSTRS